MGLGKPLGFTEKHFYKKKQIAGPSVLRNTQAAGSIWVSGALVSYQGVTALLRRELQIPF
jgi:hypothetical protein